MMGFLDKAQEILFEPMKACFDTNVFITDTNRLAQIPPNPYVDINLMSLQAQDGTGNILSEVIDHDGEEFESDVKQTRNTEDMMVLSITANADDFETAQAVGNYVFDALHWRFMESFNDEGYSINNIESLENRTAYQLENYDFRFGFDVIYLIDRDIVRITDTIEIVKINEKSIDL